MTVFNLLKFKRVCLNRESTIGFKLYAISSFKLKIGQNEGTITCHFDDIFTFILDPNLFIISYCAMEFLSSKHNKSPDPYCTVDCKCEPISLCWTSNWLNTCNDCCQFDDDENWHDCNPIGWRPHLYIYYESTYLLRDLLKIIQPFSMITIENRIINKT